MKAGTREQAAAVEKWIAGLGDGVKYNYTEACAMLMAHNQFEDRGYSYGHSWLVVPVPDEIIREVCALFEVESPI